MSSEFERAKQFIPGGVNSPARAFKAVGGEPIFMNKADGCRIWDIEGNEYIDYVCSWGPMILGHCRAEVVLAVQQQAARAMSFGMPTTAETRLAELVVAHVPSIEMVRFVNSGTEATMSAIRLARAYTGRDLIVKFEGCYHGHADSFLSKAGSGLATLGTPTSPGVPARTAASTLDAQFNSSLSVEKLFEEYPDQIAGVIVEPVVGNMGCVPPNSDFLQGLREVCSSNGALLIFDEVMTGFRLSLGGAQQLFGVAPDITTLGKVIGGGMPVGAYGASTEIMQKVAPIGDMYQAGTLSGNPLAMAAGTATLTLLAQNERIYAELESDGAFLQNTVESHVREKGYPICVQRVGSMGTIFFQEGPVRNWFDSSQSNKERFAAYFWAMIEEGIHMPPSQFEAWFHSAAHSNKDIEYTAAAMCRALDKAHDQVPKETADS